MCRVPSRVRNIEGWMMPRPKWRSGSRFHVYPSSLLTSTWLVQSPSSSLDGDRMVPSERMKGGFFAGPRMPGSIGAASLHVTPPSGDRMMYPLQCDGLTPTCVTQRGKWRTRSAMGPIGSAGILRAAGRETGRVPSQGGGGKGP